MITILLALLLTGGSAPQAHEGKRRIASITYNPATYQLTWVVERQGSDKPQNYEIDLEATTMRFDGKARKFDPREAMAVLRYLAELEEYAIVSVQWWEEGKGDPVPVAGAAAQGGKP